MGERRMGRLDRLLEELCPEGVEYRKLGDVAQYAKKRTEAAQVNESTYVGVENLLPNKQGKIKSSYVPQTGVVIVFEKGDILIGNIRPYLRKIWLADCEGGTNGDVLAIQINRKEKITPGFLYYVLSSERFFLYDIENSKGAKMPRGDKKAVLEYRVPTPPLPIQTEIVRILDNFSELSEKLATELAMRRKQYEYYRDKLLTPDCGTRWFTIGEVCDLSAGGDIPKGHYSKERNNKYRIPIYSNGVGKNALYGFTDQAKIENVCVTISARGTLDIVRYKKSLFIRLSD
ncbi:MAG: hypothetical protein HFG26_12480 [Provencibacterium sp.]|nr:hypothetical protein [Provencibacterium sp.]